MNKAIRMILAAGAVLASSQLEAKTFYDYKCYAYLENDTYAVIDVEPRENDATKAIPLAMAEGHKYPGQEVQRVLQVLECIERDEEFSDANARRLDELKLR